VHGPATSAAIVYALCAASVAVLVVARLAHAVSSRELLMATAPLAQAAFLSRRGPDGITRADCIAVTYGGAGLLLFFLLGTSLWQRAGLPMDL
jgi:hypothetical protein